MICKYIAILVVNQVSEYLTHFINSDLQFTIKDIFPFVFHYERKNTHSRYPYQERIELDRWEFYVPNHPISNSNIPSGLVIKQYTLFFSGICNNDKNIHDKKNERIELDFRVL